MKIQAIGDVTKVVGEVVKALGEIMAAYPVVASILCAIGFKQLCE